MSAHTPGPWRIKTSGNHGNLIEAQSGRDASLDSRWLDDGYRAVATFQECCASDRYDEQQENRAANGRLIAAAPDLLEQHEANKADIELLIRAIGAGDPMPELAIRASDLLVRTERVIRKATGASA